MKKSRWLIYSLSLISIMGLAIPFSYAGVLFDHAGKYSNTAIDHIESVSEKSPLKVLTEQRDKLAEKYDLQIQPYFKTLYEYTDNTFKEPNPDKPDSIWTFTPGVTANYPFKFGKIGIAYEANFRYFTKFSKQNAQEQAFATYADLYPSKETYIHVTESFNQREATSGARFLESVHYHDNDVSATSGYKWKEWTGEFGYENFYRHFSQRIYSKFDYDENKFLVRLYRDLMSDKIKGYIGDNIGFIEYANDPSRSTTYNEIIPIGIEGEMPGGATVSAHLGIHLRNIHSDFHQDLNILTPSIFLKKTFASKTTTQVALMRRPVEATFDLQTASVENLVYGEVSHLLTPKFRARMGLSVGRNNFKEPSIVGPFTGTRHDTTFGLDLGVDYAARKWLIFNCDYRVERRNSNISGFDETENRLSLGTVVPV